MPKPRRTSTPTSPDAPRWGREGPGKRGPRGKTAGGVHVWSQVLRAEEPKRPNPRHATSDGRSIAHPPFPFPSPFPFPFFIFHFRFQRWALHRTPSPCPPPALPPRSRHPRRPRRRPQPLAARPRRCAAAWPRPTCEEAHTSCNVYDLAPHTTRPAAPQQLHTALEFPGPSARTCFCGPCAAAWCGQAAAAACRTRSTCRGASRALRRSRGGTLRGTTGGEHGLGKRRGQDSCNGDLRLPDGTVRQNTHLSSHVTGSRAKEPARDRGPPPAAPSLPPVAAATAVPAATPDHMRSPEGPCRAPPPASMALGSPVGPLSDGT
jgi:hypothetical protein